MRKVKPFMYISDPRHPNHKEFLRLTREGPNRNGGKKGHNKKGDKARPNYASYNPFSSNKPKYSYVLSEHIHRI